MLPDHIDPNELIKVPEGVPPEFQLVVAVEYSRIYNFAPVDRERCVFIYTYYK